MLELDDEDPPDDEDELLDGEELLEPDELDELDDEELDGVLDELVDDELELLLGLEELLDPPALDDELEAPPPDEELPPADDEPSGDVGVAVQPAVNPAAMTAAGAPESSNRNSRRFVSSPASVAGVGRVGEGDVFLFTKSSHLCHGQRQGAAAVVPLNPLDDLIGGDHVHATRERTYDVDAKSVGPVIDVAVAERQRARLPAAPVVATSQRPDRVNELVVWIRREVRRFTSPGHDNARPVLRHPGLDFDGRREVHQETDCRQRTVRVIHQPHELAV